MPCAMSESRERIHTATFLSIKELTLSKLILCFSDGRDVKAVLGRTDNFYAKSRMTLKPSDL